MSVLKINSKNIGRIFALSLLVPPNFGFDIGGINLEDLPLIILFLFLVVRKIKDLNISNSDKVFSGFLIAFIFYTSFISNEFELFNQTNLRIYYYFSLVYLCVDIVIKDNNSIFSIFNQLSIVMIANFLVIVFQIQLPGFIDGWILNNSGSLNPLSSGRLGGLQGGGPNVIGIICSVYAFICIQKIINSDDIFLHLLSNKFNSVLTIISLFNLYLTYSRGSYLALLIGLVILVFNSKKINRSQKKRLFYIGTIFSILVIYLLPSVFLKQSNRFFLNSLAIENVKPFKGVGGGNYIKEVYREYLVTLDEDIVKEQFNISYTDDEKQLSLSKVYSGLKGPAEGYLKLKFDYRDGFLPRSTVSFYYSNDFNTWEQLGSKHTSGYVINLIENNSYFEVGGYADGQSPGDMYLRGIIQKLNINSDEFKLEAIFSESTKDKDYFIFLPASDRSFDNRNEGAIRYEQNGLKLIKPRSYWIGVPNSYNLSGKDFEVVLKVKFDEIPNGNQTLFSQSSILYANDQSWKWSIINGKMYFFWIEDLMSGYSNFVGGMSMRSAELISDNGAFDSKISEFSLGQYDEITTSHNGFLTMAVEYGLFPVIILFSCICYLTIINLKKDNKLESALMIMLLIQNFTNDLIYAPDVAIYFWLIPIYFFKKSLSS